ncbi:MAG: ABC transporter ATP-binding protein [Bacteroidota bacterium]|nr:ABC transporter ATP-binding protein [Bacteroidota bacterium]MDX5428791.1 ABC transporter ATP-binding protein [Bacteroidota bacterium]
MELKIEHLSKTYPNGVKALHNVNLNIPQGMFGLLGPNGAGKSSLMRTIATLQDPDEGSINFGDINVLEQKEELRKVLGYLPQEFGVYPKVSAEMMLDHIARLKGVSDRKQRKEIVHSLLDRVNLFKERKRNLGTYSGGMKQRFGIALALVGSPKLLIVDEPTAGLDPVERNRFYNLLSAIGENTVVILSTHIVEDVQTLCKQFAIICAGEVLLQTTPHDAVNMLDGKVWTRHIPKDELEVIRSTYQVISTQLNEGKLYVRVVSDVPPGPEFKRDVPNLEDVYFDAISRKMDLVTL